MRVIPINTVDGCCKCLVTRMGRLSWENFLGRLEHGGLGLEDDKCNGD